MRIGQTGGKKKGILAGGIPGFRIEPLLLHTPFIMAIFCGSVLFWFVFAFQMACAKDGTHAAIGIHLKSTQLSSAFFVLFFVWLFGFLCFAFCGFCFVCLLVVLCSFSAIGWLYGLCKGPHQLSFVAFFLPMALHALQFNFRQVKACVTTWRKPRRRWTEKKSCSQGYLG